MAQPAANPPLITRKEMEELVKLGPDQMAALASHLTVKGTLHGITGKEWVQTIGLSYPTLPANDGNVMKLVAQLQDSIRIVEAKGIASSPTWPPV